MHGPKIAWYGEMNKRVYRTTEIVRARNFSMPGIPSQNNFLSHFSYVWNAIEIYHMHLAYSTYDHNIIHLQRIRYLLFPEEAMYLSLSYKK